MTSAEFDSQMDRVRKRFIAMHHDRHDRLEILLEKVRVPEHAREALAETETILHKIAGSAATLGMVDLGLGAGQVEEFVRSHLTSGQPDIDTLYKAFDAFLDVSLEVCNPTNHFQEAI